MLASSYYGATCYTNPNPNPNPNPNQVIAESSNYVMLGFMGDDPHETVASMRSWQQVTPRPSMLPSYHP